jgi:hypothetical protein
VKDDRSKGFEGGKSMVEKNDKGTKGESRGNDYREAKESDGKVLDVLKKVMNTGLGAAFMTEEVVKNIFHDMSLPKDVMGNLLQGAKSTKEEFLKAVTQGVNDYLKQIHLTKELHHILDRYEFDFQVKMTLRPKSSPTHSMNENEEKSKL